MSYVEILLEENQYMLQKVQWNILLASWCPTEYPIEYSVGKKIQQNPTEYSIGYRFPTEYSIESNRTFS